MIPSDEESEVAADEPSLGAIVRPAANSSRAACMSVASERMPAGSSDLEVHSGPFVQGAAVALERAIGYLREQQDEAGWWKGELETNVTMDAEDLLLREFLGIRTAEETAAGSRLDPFPAARRRHVGQLLRRPGRSVDDDRGLAGAAARRETAPTRRTSAKAAGVVLRGRRGREPRVFTRIWLALFGLWSWDELPDLPPELMSCSAGRRLNVYDLACWARQTIVPLTDRDHPGPQRALPGIDELPHGCRCPGIPVRALLAAAASSGSTVVLHRYARRPLAGCGGSAAGARVRWIITRQEADGGVGRDPAALGVLAAGAAPERLRARLPGHGRGHQGLEGFLVHEETPPARFAGSRPASRRSGTPRSRSIGLLDAGVDPQDPMVSRAARWVESTRRSASAATGRCGGRSSHRAAGRSSSRTTITPTPTTPPRSCSRCDRVLPRPARIAARSSRGVAWTGGMECRGGGLGAFDADNTRELAYKLPFCDFGAVIDPPSADVTAHVSRCSAAEGRARYPACQPGRRLAARASRSPTVPGSDAGAANHVYGVGAAVPALVAAGVEASAPAIVRAVRWLQRTSERGRRLGRGHALLRRPGLGRPRRVDRVADRLGAAWRCWRREGRAGKLDRGSGLARSPIRPLPGPGTSRSSPAPGFPATSTSTITCTGTCSRCRRSAGTAAAEGRWRRWQ